MRATHVGRDSRLGSSRRLACRVTGEDELQLLTQTGLVSWFLSACVTGGLSKRARARLVLVDCIRSVTEAREER